MFKKKKISLTKDRMWKEKNKLYLSEIQNLMDKLDNITDERLKQKILGQMLRCDNILTELAEEKFDEYYKLGYKKGKQE